MTKNEQPERLCYFAVTDARFGRRGNVREEMDPFLHLDLLSVNAPPAELRLGFADALHLVEQITRELQGRCRRADIARALSRTEPGNPVSEVERDAAR